MPFSNGSTVAAVRAVATVKSTPESARRCNEAAVKADTAVGGQQCAVHVADVKCACFHVFELVAQN